MARSRNRSWKIPDLGRSLSSSNDGIPVERPGKCLFSDRSYVVMLWPDYLCYAVVDEKPRHARESVLVDHKHNINYMARAGDAFRQRLIDCRFYIGCRTRCDVYWPH